MIKIGVAALSQEDSFSAGHNVGKKALINAQIQKPSFCFAFCSGSLDAKNFLQGLQSSIGTEVMIIGGSTIGIISNDFLSYSGFPCGALVVETDEMECLCATAGNINNDEYMAGNILGQKLNCTDYSKIMILLYDSIKQVSENMNPPVMNASPPLISGITDALKAQVPLFGAGVLSDYTFNHTNQFYNSNVVQQSAVGMILGGDFNVYSKIMHGCTPKDGIYHTITRAEGSIIYEIDNRPIVESINEMYGNEEWQNQKPVKRLTLGVYHGEKFCDFNEAYFVNRLIMGILPDKSGIMLFEPDLENGAEILFMLRDNEKMITSAKNNTVEIVKQIVHDDQVPLFGLYIDCAGRTTLWSQTLSEEAAEVQQVLNQYNIPFLGFYSGVEIAPLLEISKGLDWTGVLILLTKSKNGTDTMVK